MCVTANWETRAHLTLILLLKMAYGLKVYGSTPLDSLSVKAGMGIRPDEMLCWSQSEKKKVKTCTENHIV